MDLKTIKYLKRLDGFLFLNLFHLFKTQLLVSILIRHKKHPLIIQANNPEYERIFSNL